MRRSLRLKEDLSNLANRQTENLAATTATGSKLTGKKLIFYDGRHLRMTSIDETSSSETLKHWFQMGLQTQYEYLNELQKFWYWAQTAPFKLQMRELTNVRTFKSNDQVTSPSSATNELNFVDGTELLETEK